MEHLPGEELADGLAREDGRGVAVGDAEDVGEERRQAAERLVCWVCGRQQRWLRGTPAVARAEGADAAMRMHGGMAAGGCVCDVGGDWRVATVTSCCWAGLPSCLLRLG